jgi:hypothetical protein
MAPAYSTTKAYQINYMKALCKKAFKNGGYIIISDLRPVLVDTLMAKGEGLGVSFVQFGMLNYEVRCVGNAEEEVG